MQFPRRAVSCAALAGLSLSLAAQEARADGGVKRVWWLPEDYSTMGHHFDSLFNIVFLETAIAFAAVVIALVYFIVRYRHRPGHCAEHERGDRPIHLAITLALALLVFVAIDMNIVHRSNVIMAEMAEEAPTPESAFTVFVTGEQFNWVVTYPGKDGEFGTLDDIEVRNEMHVPVNQKVLVRLTSRDVIHAFNVPQLRVKMDAVPGMETRVWFQITEPTKLELACAELCGWGHYIMRGRLVAESAEDVQRWLAEREAFQNAAR